MSIMDYLTEMFSGGGQTQDQALEQRLRTNQQPATVTPTERDPEQEEQVKRFLKNYGYDDASIGQVFNMPPEEQDKLFSKLLARPPKQQQKQQQQPRNREALKKLIPEMAPYFDGLTDSDLDQLVRQRAKQIQEGKVGNVQYRTNKDKNFKLKILDDENFQKSGLKQGDTVCITI